MLGIDTAADRLVDPLRRSRPVTRAMVHLTNSAVYSLVWIGIGLLGTAFDDARRRTWLLVIAGSVVEFVLTNAPVKLLFRRGRPVDPLDGEWVRGVRRPRTSSFPSGHASAAGYMAVATAGLPGWPVVLVLGALIALSRVFLRVHHATDVLAGLAWGALFGAAWRGVVL